MKTGTKSILFGVHQFIWHPITVYRAWKRLYGNPSWKVIVCIIIHDWGYWGSPNMDGVEGEKHPEYAAELALKWFGYEYYLLCLYHSRHYARNAAAEPSKLCWADKLSVLYEPWWFYLFRARLSGELKEYRKVAADAGFISLSVPDKEWFTCLRCCFIKLGEDQKNSADFANPTRK